MTSARKTRRLELYDPDKTVLRSTTRQESTERGQSTIDSGSPDINFRGDSMSGALSEQEKSMEQRTDNYEINKEEQNIIAAVGDISRLSIAVIVDGTYEKNAEGQMVFTPRSAEEIQRIQQLISNAVGYDRARGDTIEVSSIAFGAEDLQLDTSLSDIVMDYTVRLGKPLLNAILVMLFLLLVVRPVVLAMIRPKVQGSEVVEGLEGLPAGESPLALLEGEEEMDALDALKQIDDIKSHTLHLCEQNMDQAIGILRSWMTKGGSSLERAA